METHGMKGIIETSENFAASFVECSGLWVKRRYPRENPIMYLDLSRRDAWATRKIIATHEKWGQKSAIVYGNE